MGSTGLPSPSLRQEETTSSGSDQLTVDGCRSALTLAHAMDCHVPWIFNETQCLTTEVTNSRKTALHLMTMILTDRGGFDILMERVNKLAFILKGTAGVTKRCAQAVNESMRICINGGLLHHHVVVIARNLMT